MLLLPKKIGAFTLTRKLGTGGVAESYVGTHDAAGGKPVVVRRILPYILRDPARLSAIEGRIQDLLGVRHPFLVHVLEHVREGEEHFIVEEYVDGVNLDKVLAWCRQNQRPIPHNVFLNIATQVCNGLEALHGRTGKGSQSEHVLHLALKPGAVFITREGKVMVGSFGLTRSPTTLPHGGVTGPVPTRMEYLSPEQTHPDQKLTPASDIFSLGAILYELLTLDSLFRADSNLQTIHKVRRAEVTTQLLRAKELMPGLDKVLYRALSLNPRHRYQRAFVLREDLRGLMAGYSFATISDDTRTFATPLLEQLASPGSLLAGAPDAPADADSFADGESTRIDADPLSTGQLSARALQERGLRDGVEDMGDSTESLALRGENDPPTVLQPEPPAAPEDRDRPTVPGTDSAASAAVAAALGAPSAVPFGAQPKRGAAKNQHIQLEKAGESPGEHTSFDPVPPNRDVRPPASGRGASPTSTAGFVAASGKGKGDASSTSAFLFDGPAGASEDPVAPVHLTPPRVAPPPPTLPPPPKPLPPAVAPPAAEPLAPAAVVGAGIASAPVAPSAPSSTAAFTGAPSPRAPSPPPAAPALSPPPVAPPAPPLAARPAPPTTPLPPLPPGATISRPTAAPALSRPMPGPNVATAPVPGHVSAPRPIPPRAPAPPPLGAAPASPVAAGPVAPRPAPPRAPAPPPPPVDPFVDEPPPRSSTGLYFGVAAVVAMGLVLVCTGVGWGGYVWYSGSSSSSPVAEAPNGEAASVMADAAPPQLAPMDPEQDAAAVLAGGGSAAPTPEPAAEPVAPTPAATPAPTVAASSPPTSSAATSSATLASTSTPTTTASRPTTTASTTSYPATTSNTRTTAPTTASTTTATRTSEPARSTTTASYSAPTTTTTSRTRPTSEVVVAEPARSTSYTAPSTAKTAAPEVVAEAPPLDVSIAEAPVSDLEQFVDSAKRGKLTSSDVSTLSAIGTSDPQYTRSRALLLMNAQRKGDESATRRYLDEIMALPENQYNPVYLTDYARWHVNRGDYSSALEKAQLAERYWARLPPELVFTKKAEIYEIEAAAWQGKFYKSGTDLELLDKAIHDWERYRDHVGSRSRSDLQERADTQIAKLNEIKERLQ